MIYDDSSIELTARGGELVIRERDTWRSLFRLFGMVPLLAGGLVLYVFFIGNGPRPTGAPVQQAFGWLVLLIIGCAMGAAPFWMGLHFLLFRGGFTLSSLHGRIQNHVLLLGRRVIRTRNYPLDRFDHVRITNRRIGAFGGSRHYVVSCDGPMGSLDLIAFHGRAEADAFAAEVGASLALPINPALPGSEAAR